MAATLWPLLFLLAVALASGWYIFIYPRWKRRRLLARPFPESWQEIVRRRLPFHSRLSADEQGQLEDMIRLFLADKQFHGCGGLALSDEIRVTIAAEACLLLLNRDSGIYPGLKHILVYPDAFRANHDQRNPDGTVSAPGHGLLGESWQNGKVILSWSDVQAGAENFSDGHNVVLHEFAHQLDGESGTTNGAPLMPAGNLQTWARVFSQEFEQLNALADHHRKSAMDYYGATNPAEFFAVATETYFEKPRTLQQHHPELYQALSRYYRVDPARWQPEHA